MRARAALALAPLAAALLASACGLTEPYAMPAGTARYEAPGLYAAWWRATEQCAGLRAPMADIAWYAVPGEEFTGFDGSAARGTWEGRGARVDRIFINAEGVRDGELVRHEMLHAIMARNYLAANHTREHFLARCGGVVSCGAGCLRERGSYARPDADAAEVAPSALARSIELTQHEASAARDSGWVSVTVAARNTSGRAVWVRMPAPTRLEFFVVHFGLQVEGAGSTGVGLPYMGDRIPLGPGETLRHVFDVQTADLAPGTHRVRALALGDSTAAVSLMVRR